MKKRILTGLFITALLAAVTMTGCSTTDGTDSTTNKETDHAEDDVSQSTVGTFTTQDIYGAEVTQDVFAGYDLTLVNLFATWCGPCVAEMPELARIQKDMKDKGVNVVAVVLDAGVGDQLDADAVSLAQELAELSEAEFTFMVPDETYMNGRIANVAAVPESFFVDKNGNIVGETYVGARDYDMWVEVIEAELANVQEAQD